MTKPIELEWHQLDLRYAGIRIHTTASIRRLMASIHTHGLLDPILVVPSGDTESSHWILIDGYLRVAALRELNQDSISALVLSCNIKDALIHLYRQSNARVWEAWEESQLIQTLIIEHKLAQAEVARQLGKSKTWVTHRLQLLHDLPDFVQTAIQQGILSTWSAHRVLLPFARANSEHAKKLIDFLSINAKTSRDIQAYYFHYLRSNRQTRQKMMDNPQHFFKARQFQQQSETTTPDKLAPEYVWEGTLSLCLSKLQQLEAVLPAVFYPKQSEPERIILMEPFMSVLNQINQLQNLVRSRIHAQTTDETNRTATLLVREEYSRD